MDIVFVNSVPKSFLLSQKFIIVDGLVLELFMKNSKFFLHILYLFLFTQSCLLLGMRERKRCGKNKRVDIQEKARRKMARLVVNGSRGLWSKQDNKQHALKGLPSNKHYEFPIMEESGENVYELIHSMREKNIRIFDLSGRLVKTIEHVKRFEIALGKYLCLERACECWWELEVFDLTVDLGEPIKTIQKIYDYKIKLKKYLCIKTYNVASQSFTLEVFDLSQELDEPIKTIENVASRCSYEFFLGKYLCVKINNKSLRGSTLLIFDVSEGLDRPIQIIEKFRNLSLHGDKTEPEKYLCVKTDNRIFGSYALKIFDLSEGLYEPIITIEKVYFRYYKEEYKPGHHIVGNNLIVISGGSEEESQLQIFNLEQLKRAIQQDEEEGEASSRVEQEYPIEPIFTYVGAVGFEVKDRFVSVVFADGRKASNVFELDNEDPISLEERIGYLLSRNVNANEEKSEGSLSSLSPFIGAFGDPRIIIKLQGPIQDDSTGNADWMIL